MKLTSGVTSEEDGSQGAVGKKAFQYLDCLDGFFWKENCEGGPFFLLAFDGDRPQMGIHNALHDGKPESCPNDLASL